MKKAPKLKDFLSSKSRDHFKKTLMLLDILNIKYEIDFSLVRGLDYYDEIVYEFVSSAKDAGSQSTIIGGGRYSNLVKELGGPDLFADRMRLGYWQIDWHNENWARWGIFTRHRRQYRHCYWD